MAYVITDDCISCGACEPECPVSCISAGDEIYVIDSEACVDCGACASVRRWTRLNRNRSYITAAIKGDYPFFVRI